MDFLTVVRLVRRWWFLVVPMFLVTTGLALLVAQSVPVSYEAKGTLLFQPGGGGSGAAVDPNISTTTRNPFGGAGSTEVLAARLIATVINDNATGDALKAAGAGDYVVTQVTSDNNNQDLPLIEIDATATSATKALATLTLVSDAAARALTEQQTASGVDPAAMMTVRPLLTDSKASSLYGGRVRAGLAVGVLGLGATVAMPFLMEGMTRSRRREATEWAEQLYGAPALPVSPEPREPANLGD